jgi:hypothetical protein
MYDQVTDSNLTPAGLFHPLGFRMFIFVFLGMGWDVLVTFTQQALAGKLERNALCPASAWMYLVYGTAPIALLLIVVLLQRLRLPYVVRLPIMVLSFYASEYTIGAIFHAIGVEAWNYRWWLDPQWSPAGGYICWHPVIVIEWAIFVFLLETFDVTAKAAYPTVKASFRRYWSRQTAP